MICPKCRTKYPEGVTVCPDCGVELFGLLGSADAPEEDDSGFFQGKNKKDEELPPVPMTVELYTDRTAEGFEEEEPVSDEPVSEEIISEFVQTKEAFTASVADGDEEFSPVVYKKSGNRPDKPVKNSSNPLGIFFLILSLLFIAASVVMFYLGSKSGKPANEAPAAVEAFIYGLLSF